MNKSPKDSKEKSVIVERQIKEVTLLKGSIPLGS